MIKQEEEEVDEKKIVEFPDQNLNDTQTSSQSDEPEHIYSSNDFDQKRLSYDFCLNDQSPCIIPPPIFKATVAPVMESNESDAGESNVTLKSSDIVDEELAEQRSEITRSSSGSQIQPENSITQPKPRKKSGSFLTKFQSSVSEDRNNGSQGNNIPSSFASAFSSFSSSLTSSFNLNSSTNSPHNSSSLTIETASTSTRISHLNETKEDIFVKKAALERKNLISLTKLIVKDLISSSLTVSRTIDDCENAIHLNNYFTLIDRVLKHGLKPNLLSNRSTSLWNALDSLPKYLKESTLMSESIRSLANTKTPDGKIKAWMRLALMQKKLPEYFNELLAQKNILLKDIYHDYAFMLNDEAQVFAGLIIGVNVIDCNFFVKDANFDLMDDIIDLSPYLKAANSYDSEQDDNENSIKSENITAVLDQKNYLEEWNRRLEGTINDLHTRIKDLENQNSKLEMEVKLSEARIQKLQKGKNSENLVEKQQAVSNSNNSSSFTDAIKNLIGNSSESKQNDVTPSTVSESNTNLPEGCSTQTQENQLVGVDQTNEKEACKQVEQNVIISNQKADSNLLQSQTELENQRILDEREKELLALKERASILEASYRSALEKIKFLERDLDIQTSINADKETTIMIYEKDIREKQSQVESLRVSLADAKKLNHDMSEKWNDANSKMKERLKTISTLQDSLSKWKLENKTIATRLQDKQTAFKSITNDLENAMKTIDELKKYNEKINEELKKERESGHSSSVTLDSQTAQIQELTAKLFKMENELKDVKPYREQTEELAQKCKDYEQSLEEVGAQLRESRLEVENLKENSAVFLDSQWKNDKQIKSCALCQQSFSVTRRKHHCRLCGNVFCQTCSDNKMELASSAKPVRVCDTCHSFLLAKFVKSSQNTPIV